MEGGRGVGDVPHNFTVEEIQRLGRRVTDVCYIYTQGWGGGSPTYAISTLRAEGIVVVPDGAVTYRRRRMDSYYLPFMPLHMFVYGMFMLCCTTGQAGPALTPKAMQFA